MSGKTEELKGIINILTKAKQVLLNSGALECISLCYEPKFLLSVFELLWLMRIIKYHVIRLQVSLHCAVRQAKHSVASHTKKQVIESPVETYEYRQAKAVEYPAREVKNPGIFPQHH